MHIKYVHIEHKSVAHFLYTHTSALETDMMKQAMIKAEEHMFYYL